jgi:NAD(P)-dependent dehydrogenase (short-subunit alcohol dehydrogenase family)
MPTVTTDHPRVVVVTGGSGGIGGETARRLARDGMAIVVAYAGRKAPAEEVVTAIIEAGGMATSFQADVAEESDVAALFDAAELTYGGVDVDRAALPHLRNQRDGLVVWVGSTSTRGGTPPYLDPYVAAKAAEDSLAVTSAAELARFGVDTVIIVPGSFTRGTNHFANAGHPEDVDVAAAFEPLHGGLMDQVSKKLADLAPPDQDPAEVARAIVRVVGMTKGTRPFRVHIDPADDGAETVNRVGDLARREFYRRIGFDDLLAPATSA